MVQRASYSCHGGLLLRSLAPGPYRQQFGLTAHPRLVSGRDVDVESSISFRKMEDHREVEETFSIYPVSGSFDGAGRCCSVHRLKLGLWQHKA